MTDNGLGKKNSLLFFAGIEKGWGRKSSHFHIDLFLVHPPTDEPHESDNTDGI